LQEDPTTTAVRLLSQLTDEYPMETAAIVLLLFLAIIFILLILFSGKRLKAQLADRKRTQRLERQLLNEQISTKTAELSEKNELIDKLHHAYAEQKEQIGRLTTLLQLERKYASEKVTILEEAKKELSLQFQSVAQRIFDEKNLTFSVQSKEKLHSILSPFQQQLHSFKRRIDDIYHQETQERFSLKQEITHLRDLNRQINREAMNLTNALKGDKKIQGNWGEMILERVLEQSGLRKGHEYETQGGFRDRDNHLLKPDVIIHLPENKEIIIDSKVSLMAWEKYVNCDNRTKKRQHFRAHLDAIKDHVEGLGNKDYTNLKGIRTLDFILMFMPIEAAFAEAFQKDEQLFAQAFTNKIIIVSPTTLLATLRSIDNIWRFEHQHRNSEEIARRASAIYDKLCNFVDDMEKLGKQIETINLTYDGAMTKLSKGRGNLIAQANRFTELGVKAKKELSKTIANHADLEVDEEDCRL